MPEKISILKESGETLSSNVVSVFMIPDTEKKYIITTENAVDPHGLTVLHVSEIVDGTLQKVATDDEWSSIKTIMRAIISGNVGSYQYLPVILNANAVGQYSRDISVSASASKQMMDNYAAGDKSGVSSDAGGASMNVGENVPMNQGAVGPEAPVVPSTIFPTGSPNNNSDNELIPGIAEVSNNPMMNGGVGMDMNVQSPMNPEMVPPMGMVPPVNPNMNMVSPLQVDSAMNMNQVGNTNPMNDNNANMIAPSINMPEVSTNGMINNNMGVSPMNGIEMPIGQMGMENSVPNSIPNVAPEVPNMVPMSELGVQVVQPTQVVPTAQIAQGSQNAPEVNLTPAVTQVGGTDVNIDEIVASVQEMLMDSVKNIAQAIYDRLYKDLAAKEKELNNREAAIAQKEANQIPTPLMGNMGMTQPLPQITPEMSAAQPMVNQGPAVMPMQPMPQQPQPMNNSMMNGIPQMTQNPNVYSPTIVSAANDVM